MVNADDTGLNQAAGEQIDATESSGGRARRPRIAQQARGGDPRHGGHEAFRAEVWVVGIGATHTNSRSGAR